MKAIEVFHSKGFTATTTQNLVDHLKINRKSLFHEFGSKQKLFESAIKHYYEVAMERNFRLLNGSEASINEIKKVFGL
jgi:TetR/AcrR family transcriptional repressor of nem operon